MRASILLTLLFLSIVAHAQFSLSTNGGCNSTAAQTKTQLWGAKYVAGLGWQTGLQAGYSFKNWTVYSGAGISMHYFKLQQASYNNEGQTYKPVFLTLPLDVSYKYAFAKKLALHFYGGIYFNKGIGGKFYSKQSIDFGPECGPGACPEIITDRNMHYGDKAYGTPPNDLAPLNWGTQFGLGIQAWKRFELVGMYNLGLNNILPADVGETLHMRFLSLDFKVNLITFLKSTQN